MVSFEIEKAADVIPKVALSDNAEQSTYAIARLLMKIVDGVLGVVGLEHNTTLSIILYAALVFFISIGVGFVAKWIIVAIMKYLSKHWNSTLYNRIFQEHLFTKSARIIPAIVFLIFIQFTLTERATLASWLTRITWIYVVFIICDSLCIAANIIWHHVNEMANKKQDRKSVV